MNYTLFQLSINLGTKTFISYQFHGVPNYNLHGTQQPRVLQTQELRVIQEEEPCIRVNTRELNRELCTRLSTLYTKLSWSMLLLF